MSLSKTYSIEIPIKPFSINSMYYVQKAVKTQPAREWTYEVFSHLNSEKNTRIMAEIHNAFIADRHNLIICLTAYYPKNKLITSTGGVSARSVDTTNWEKPLIDLLFLPKHWGKEDPFGCKNIGIDDRYICSMTSKKRAWDGPGYKITVKVKLRDNEYLYQSPERCLSK